MFLSGQTIRRRRLLTPFVERSVAHGMSYGLSHAGYDVRIAEDVVLYPGDFALASTYERFAMPTDLLAFVHDKSTWARRGLSLFNTVIEPGWTGYLTLELVNNSRQTLRIEAGMPIAQILFALTDLPVDKPYAGKFQNQEAGPQKARFEQDDGTWK